MTQFISTFLVIFCLTSISQAAPQLRLLGQGRTASGAMYDGILSVKNNGLLARQVDFSRVSKFEIPFDKLSPTSITTIENTRLDQRYCWGSCISFANLQNQTLYYWTGGHSSDGDMATVVARSFQASREIYKTKDFRKFIVYGDNQSLYLGNTNALTKVDLKTGKSKMKKFSEFPYFYQQDWFFDAASEILLINGPIRQNNSSNILRIWNFKTGSEIQTGDLGGGSEGMSRVTVRGEEIITANFDDPDYYLTLRAFTKNGIEKLGRFKSANDTFISEKQGTNGNFTGRLAFKYLQKSDLIAAAVNKTLYLIDPKNGNVVSKVAIAASGSSLWAHDMYYDPESNVIALHSEDRVLGTYGGYFMLFKIE